MKMTRPNTANGRARESFNRSAHAASATNASTPFMAVLSTADKDANEAGIRASKRELAKIKAANTRTEKKAPPPPAECSTEDSKEDQKVSTASSPGKQESNVDDQRKVAANDEKSKEFSKEFSLAGASPVVGTGGKKMNKGAKLDETSLSPGAISVAGIGSSTMNDDDGSSPEVLYGRSEDEDDNEFTIQSQDYQQRIEEQQDRLRLDNDEIHDDDKTNKVHEVCAELVDDAEDRERQHELEDLRHAMAAKEAQEAEIAVAVVIKNQALLDDSQDDDADDDGSKARHKRLCCCALFALVAVAAGVIAGVLLAGSGDGDAPPLIIIPQTARPSAPVPTASPTAVPTGLPTLRPEPVCFVDRNTLENAVDIFLDTSAENAETRRRMLLVRGPTMNDWCVGQVDNFINLFRVSRNPLALTFNENISNWDTSRCLDFNGLFDGAASFNQDLSQWDTSRVTSMANTFRDASTFNQDLSTWDMSKVQTVVGMFNRARSFNQNLTTWNTSSVEQMVGFLMNTDSFNGDVTTLDVSKVIRSRNCFLNNPNINQDLSKWELSSALDIRRMFSGATAFNGNITGWDISRIQILDGVFAGASSFNQDISGWNTSSCVDMQEMFKNAAAFDQDLSSWDVSKVEIMRGMFHDASSFVGQGLSAWDVSRVKDLEEMFSNAVNMTQDLCAWGPRLDAETVTAVNMFLGSGCLEQDDPVLIGSNDTGVAGPLCAKCESAVV